MKTLLLTAAILAASFTGPAFAQVVTLVELDDDVLVQPFNLTVGKLEDLAITDMAGSRLGEIEKVIGTAENGPTALVIDAENSETDYIVPLERFTATNGVITVDISAADLAKLPAYTN